MASFAGTREARPRGGKHGQSPQGTGRAACAAAHVLRVPLAAPAHSAARVSAYAALGLQCAATRAASHTPHHAEIQPGRCSLMGRYNLAAYHDQECLVYNPLYSDPTPNCSFCAAVKSVILLDEFSNFTQYYYGQADPVLVKGGQKDHVGLEDVQHLHAVHGKTLDLRPDEVSCSNDSVSSFSHLFRLFPTEETLARSSTTFQWKTQRVAGTRLLRELFPRPYFISPDSEVSLLKLLILQGSQATPHALVFQLQFYNAWLAIGSGSLSLHLTPVPACHAPCRTLSVHAQAGDLAPLIDTTGGEETAVSSDPPVLNPAVSPPVGPLLPPAGVLLPPLADGPAMRTRSKMSRFS
ncbi:uncharacterized protein LOC116947048 isoform X3 [Petromyzon marinus]|uniref:uncharacterized protein LOC116947048 isoform X3 n=1 Tax=Petromyzon marinus TaxID=7757 RepID=UPI003F70EDFC